MIQDLPSRSHTLPVLLAFYYPSLLSLSVFTLLAQTVACHRAPSPAPGPSPTTLSLPASSNRDSARAELHLIARHAAFHLSDEAVMQVEYLRGTAIPAHAGSPVTLDDKTSFLIHIDAAETSITDAHLSALMNQRILPDSHSPIKTLDVTFANGAISARGKLSKGIDTSFEATAELVPAKDGLIHVHVTNYKAAGILHKGFFDFLGIKLSDVANKNHPAGLQFDNDNLVIEPSLIFAPPKVEGHLQSVRIDGNRLVQVFGPAQREPQPDPPLAQESYIYFVGGTMRFGKLTMNDVDLELLDMEKQPYFDFSIDHYLDQIAAGYSKSQKNLGLIVYLAPYSKVAGRARADSN